MVEKIAILGDFNPAFETLHKLNDSVRDIQKKFDEAIQFDWIATDVFNSKVVFEQQNYKGLWITPGSPYKDMNNVLATIKYARENNIPTFGNCGGFQHMVIEFAKNICGIEKADHAETNPDSQAPVIKKLVCSLKGEQENLTIINHSSLLYNTYQKEHFLGKYYCSYGVNEEYVDMLTSKGLIFTSKSEDGHYRSFEISTHPFFVGTLFQPALTSTTKHLNPMIVEFVKASIKRKLSPIE